MNQFCFFWWTYIDAKNILILPGGSSVCISVSLARCTSPLQIKPACAQLFVLPTRGPGAVPARAKLGSLRSLRLRKLDHPKTPKPNQQQRPKLPPRGKRSWRSQLFLEMEVKGAMMKLPKLMGLVAHAAAMLARDVSLAVGPASNQENEKHESDFPYHLHLMILTCWPLQGKPCIYYDRARKKMKTCSWISPYFPYIYILYLLLPFVWPPCGFLNKHL